VNYLALALFALAVVAILAWRALGSRKVGGNGSAS